MARTRTRSIVVVALLATSAMAVALAPLLMPESYSVIEHSVSESAAQGVEGAWLARLGFILLGLGVLSCVSLAGDRWGLWGRAAHRLYGVSMLGTATFSHRPWLDVPFDVFEDLLHSATAYGVGFGFTVGVIVVSLRRGPGKVPIRAFDAFVVIAALGISMMVVNATGMAGLAQRTMFGLGYAWYAGEAIRSFEVGSE